MATKLEYGAKPKLAKKPAANILKIMPFFRNKKGFKYGKIIDVIEKFSNKYHLSLVLSMLFRFLCVPAVN